ncbi:MAG: PIG-L family deacetylase [Alphaproteobacteria bacterium]
MKPLHLARAGEPLSVLCLGAHSDDIEIGAGGTILNWIAAGALLNVHWCVLSARAARADEAAASAEAFLARASGKNVELCEFRDGYFPYDGVALKDWFEGLKQRVNPDVVLTHQREDAHQDHREICALTWNSFRDHLILEYEIPKWDGDLGQPNFYIPVNEDILTRKIELLQAHFGSQRSKDWFNDETFRGLARLRGMEARAPSSYAEAFYARKLVAG